MPRLRTDRLFMAPVRLLDVPALHAHWTEPDVRCFLWDGRTISEDEVRAVVRTSERLFDEHGAGLWALRGVTSAPPHASSAGGDRPPDSAAETTTEAEPLIGCAGFWLFHEPPELEFLVSLSPDQWGQGLAQECAHALIEYAFTRLGWEAVQASADAPNEASLALMRRLGMRPAGERPGVFGPILVFRVDRSEWRARRDPAGGQDPA